MAQIICIIGNKGGSITMTGRGAGGEPLVSNIAWAIVALSMYAGAFNVEIFRSGIEAVPRATLEAAGAEVVGQCFFDDHHPYTEDEIVELKAIAGAAQLVTTEKDFVRLSVAQREGIRLLRAAARFDEPAGLDRLLDSALAGR